MYFLYLPTLLEQRKIDKIFIIFKKSGVFDLIDVACSKEYHFINRHKLIVLMSYRHASLRDMISFWRFDLRTINIMDNTIPSHTSIGKFYDAKSKPKFWIAQNDLQSEVNKNPNAKRSSNKVNKKKVKKEAKNPKPKS